MGKKTHTYFSIPRRGVDFCGGHITENRGECSAALIHEPVGQPSMETEGKYG
jgi:hypothetical protein